jgi:hypothetical protein
LGFEYIEIRYMQNLSGGPVYSTEKLLVDQFVRVLGSGENPWGPVAVSCEFFYSRGTTDVVALTDNEVLIAFEAKLKDWRCALDQAYRNTCFAHKSFVVVPKSTAYTAFAYIAEFRRRGVGLCYLDGEGLTVLEEPAVSTPIEPWIAAKAMGKIMTDREAV